MHILQKQPCVKNNCIVLSTYSNIFVKTMKFDLMRETSTAEEKPLRSLFKFKLLWTASILSHRIVHNNI